MTTSPVKETDPKNTSHDLKAEQALGLVGLGLMQKITSEGKSGLNWLFEETEEKADLVSLRQRLELTSLAIETGAPLSTAEVTHLLGVRPSSAKTERGGLVARRLTRNVWKLYKAEKDSNYWRN
ncbi:hypothetical protein [Prochlorococcus sp. MIT 1223]|uniref:hypothetical protein n=1 Tax=Prochlorococcus sp. MIT 1223 TaxID=3096217 RepID=UPI002A74E1BF|nr:hypothetical protein [Prochlorococcus sp. MIT 1223]